MKNKIIDQNILECLSDLFPKNTSIEKLGGDYINALDGWYFTDDEILNAVENDKMIHLDYEFGDNCSLKCYYCFRTNDERDRGTLLNSKDWEQVLVQSKELGLKSVKLLGAGELTENKKFFSAIETIVDLDIKPVLFTAAHVIGDDVLANKYHGMSGAEMAQKLKDLNVSVMVKVNSFDSSIQDQIVGVSGYSKKRNDGLRKLLESGLNQSNPTKLGLEVAMMRTNIGELEDIYKLKEALNLYIDLDPFMPCGNTRTVELSNLFDLSVEEKMKLYESVYLMNLKANIPFRGISPYAGGQECSQLGYGLYINVRGDVFPCPGAHTHMGNVKETSLSEIWKNNTTKSKYRGYLTHGCPYREESGILYKGWEKDITDSIKLKQIRNL